MLGNGVAAGIALLVARANDLGLGGPVNQVLVCGAAAMLVLRSAVANVRLGERDVSVGLGAIIESLLATFDRVIDRNQATTRSETVRSLMQHVSFEKAYDALPAHCLYLMVNAPPDDATRLSSNVAQIFGSNYTDQVKAYNLGVVLLDFAGEQVLKGAVKTLGNEITGATTP